MDKRHSMSAERTALGQVLWVTWLIYKTNSAKNINIFPDCPQRNHFYNVKIKRYDKIFNCKIVYCVTTADFRRFRGF